MLNSKTLLNNLGATRKGEHPYLKLNKLVDYIVENNDGKNTDNEKLFEVINLGKKNILETVLHAKEETKANTKSRKIIAEDPAIGDYQKANNIMAKFVKAPETTIKVMLKDKLRECGEEEYEKKEKLRKAIDALDGKEKMYSNYEKEKAPQLHDKLNITQHLVEAGVPEENAIQDTLDACKPGFWERTFRRTSKQYKTFEKAFKDRMEGGKTSREDLNKAARAYIKHKFPDFDGVTLPRDYEIAELDVKSINRIQTCIAVLKGTAKSNGFDQREKLLKDSANQVLKEANEKETFEKTMEVNSKDPLIAREEAVSNELNKDLQDNIVNDINKIEGVNFEEQFKDMKNNIEEEVDIDDPDMSMGQ